MLIFFLSIKTLLIKVQNNLGFVAFDGTYLFQTPNIKEASEFEFIQNENGIDFYIQLAKTNLVWDYPRQDFGGNIILYRFHGGSNQKWRLIFNKLGSLNIVNNDRRVVYNEYTNLFTTKKINEYMNGEEGFVIFDEKMHYFDFFNHVPVQNIMNVPSIEHLLPLGKELRKPSPNIGGPSSAPPIMPLGPVNMHEQMFLNQMGM
ncbi:hypothetical protein H312_01328 [Anncaliia algerae PRA339]|uniref:Ricin B lectin domain-containing protein n=1 Tax=Anncaliia algerae PRA339 TaxID=1288291 RepID=A0A059F230_9MICR|nr:hypothetical protein H312_01328 [Anncaliia algerae PRA339]